jgi:hypothetical protein
VAPTPLQTFQHTNFFHFFEQALLCGEERRKSEKMRKLLAIFFDPFNSDQADEIPDSQMLDLWHIILAGVVLGTSIIAAIDGVRRYYKNNKNWVTFLLARLTVGGAVFQIINLTSVVLGLWPYSIGVRILWFLVPLGSTANLSLNLWRLNVFRYDRLPKQWISAFQMNNLVPYIICAAYVCCWPIYSWIFEEEAYFSKEFYIQWANWGFVVWLGIFGFLDLFGVAVALYKVIEYRKAQGFALNLLAIFTCISIMLACDVYLALEVVYLAYKSEFPYRRVDIAPLYSLAIGHLNVSYLYLLLIVRYTLHIIPNLDAATSQGALVSQVSSDKNLPSSNAAGVEFATLVHGVSTEDEQRRFLAINNKKPEVKEEKKLEKIEEKVVVEEKIVVIEEKKIDIEAAARQGPPPEFVTSAV